MPTTDTTYRAMDCTTHKRCHHEHHTVREATECCFDFWRFSGFADRIVVAADHADGGEDWRSLSPVEEKQFEAARERIFFGE